MSVLEMENIVINWLTGLTGSSCESPVLFWDKSLRLPKFWIFQIRLKAKPIGSGILIAARVVKANPLNDCPSFPCFGLDGKLAGRELIGQLEEPSRFSIRSMVLS